MSVYEGSNIQLLKIQSLILILNLNRPWQHHGFPSVTCLSGLCLWVGFKTVNITMMIAKQSHWYRSLKYSCKLDIIKRAWGGKHCIHVLIVVNLWRSTSNASHNDFQPDMTLHYNVVYNKIPCNYININNLCPDLVSHILCKSMCRVTLIAYIFWLAMCHHESRSLSSCSHWLEEGTQNRSLLFTAWKTSPAMHK